MSEFNNTTAEGGITSTTEGQKTFSQDDVNRIVGERLGKEKSKMDAELAEREQGLAQREFLLSAKTTLADKGLPAELLDALNLSTPEAFEKSLNIFDQYVQSLTTTNQNETDPAADELTRTKQAEFLATKGVDTYSMELYQLKIDKLAKEIGVPFEDAAEKYISDNPPYKRPPDFYTGKGSAHLSGNSKGDDVRAAMGLRKKE